VCYLLIESPGIAVAIHLVGARLSWGLVIFLGLKNLQIDRSGKVVMKRISISKLLAYFVAAVSISVGVLRLIGVLFPKSVPAQMRITLGIVLILMGVYRLVITRVRS
jgi:hypothetical protein